MIADHHLEMLAASGITPEHAEARGYETIRDTRRLAELGIAKAGQRTQGLLVPQLRVDRSTWGYQYRPDSPRERRGQIVKYETPISQRNGIDVPPGIGGKLSDPNVPLWITEGVKKADCGALHGLCIVAIPGVWSWRGTNSLGGKTAIPDFHDIALNGRRVILAFDGDVARKESVRKALRELAEYLKSKGAKVEYLHLPDADAKVGLDDYLAEHTVEELWRLVRPTQPQTEFDDHTVEYRQAVAPTEKPALKVVEPIDGAELLNDVERFASRFLAFPTAHHLVVLVLWIAHTWAVNAFYVTPRLVLDSPEPGSGKTRVLEILALLCQKAKLTLSTTTAALYRRIAAADDIGDPPPTILQDEADAVFGKIASPQAEELRALFNSGYKRGATVDRCEGDAKNMQVREFPVFAPVAFAGLAGKMPQTILDRAVVMHMRRRAPDEHIEEFRERDASAEASPLTEKLFNWAACNTKALMEMRPAMPKGVRDRPAEVWEALLCIADFAGGQWPGRARDACRYFVLDTGTDDKLSFGVRLLRDTKTVFGDQLDRMHSAELVAALTLDPESEWRDLWGKPLDQRRLAKELKRYGVQSNDIRIGDTNKKGYQVDGDDGLGQAWLRYLHSVSERDKRDKGDIAGQPVADVSRTSPERDKRDTSATLEMPSEQRLFGNVADVADVALVPRNGHQPGSAEQHAAYRNGKCVDCNDRPPAAGRPRCDECYRIHSKVMAGYDR